MFGLIYEKTCNFMKREWKLLLIYIIVVITCCIPIPYYIDKPGGAIDIREKIDMDNAYKSKGGFYYGYVSEIHATIPLYLYSLINKDWELMKKEDLAYDNETIEQANLRSDILMEETNSNAILIAYKAANRDVKINSEKLYINYIDPIAETNLSIGDEIISVNGDNVNNRMDLISKVRNIKKGEEVKINIKKDDKIIERKATVQELDGISLIGATISSVKELETNPKIKINMSPNESGPSGGLMLSLTIYDMLTKKDLTKGYKIVGTGTMEEDGTVGAIGGVEYKLKGAVKKKADIFLVPAGENYDDAMKLKKERKYNIKIKAINNFEEAVEYLENLPSN